MIRFLPVFVLLSSSFFTGAQQSAPATKASSIAGMVVQEPGSQPLKKVLVQVVAENQKQGGNYTASTDADGHFHIDNVVTGRYRIFFEKTGLVGVNGRGLKSDINVVTVLAGQSAEDLVFRMMPTAVISGRITDEDGDPMSEVRVVAQRKRPGRPARESAGMATTNDLGEYRLPGLFAGQYWVVAMPPPDFRDYEKQQRAMAGDKSDMRTDIRYLPTYYPGSYDPQQAATLTLKPGDDMPVNFTLLPARTYRVQGIVAGIKAGQKATVELMSKVGDSMRATEVGSDGQFELRGVAPGSYVAGISLDEESQSLSARQDINVSAADVDGLKLVPQPSFTISGLLRIEGNAALDLTPYSVNLRQADLPEDTGLFMSQNLFGTNAPVDRMGNFVWKDVSPGNYIVQVYAADGQGLFLKSVTLGGRDITTGFTASGPVSLNVAVSAKAGTVEGMVVEKEKDVEDEHPVPNATVVAVPEERFRKLPDRFGTGTTDQNGRFAIRGMAPGSYTLYAWQDIEDSVWRDPDFLKTQEANGTAIKVEEGSAQQLELKLSPAAEEWR